MSASLPFILLLILAHLGMYLTSFRRQRLKKLLQALSFMVLAVLLLLLGKLFMDAGDTGNVLLHRMLKYSPLLLSVLSFLVYLRRP